MCGKGHSLVRIQGIPGPWYFNEKGCVVKAVISGPATATKTYNTSMFSFGTVNNGTPDSMITINTFSVIIKPPKKVGDLFGPYKSITITAAGALKSVVSE